MIGCGVVAFTAGPAYAKDTPAAKTCDKDGNPCTKPGKDCKVKFCKTGKNKSVEKTPTPKQ
jgi:hypothetical protein